MSSLVAASFVGMYWRMVFGLIFSFLLFPEDVGCAKSYEFTSSGLVSGGSSGTSRPVTGVMFEWATHQWSYT